MYAVIETGGKQYRVEVGTQLEVEHLEVEPGQEITLDRVLLVADGELASIGRPLVADAIVSAEVLRQDRGEKLISFKYRPKARSRVKKGHRQELTILRVTEVRLGERSGAEDMRKVEAEQQSHRDRAREAAAKQAAADAELAAKLAAATPAATPEKPARGRGRGAAAAAPAAAEQKGRAKTAPKADAPAAGRGAKADAAPKGAKPAKAADKPSTPRAARPKKDT